MIKFNRDQLEYMINCVGEQVLYLREELERMNSFDHTSHWVQSDADRNTFVEEHINDLNEFEDCLAKLTKMQEDL